MRSRLVPFSLVLAVGIGAQETLNPLWIRPGHGLGINAVEFSPDSRILASGASDNTVKLWETGSWRYLRTLIGPNFEVSGLDFSPDGTLLAVSSRDFAAYIFRVSDGALLQRIQTPFHCSGVAFSPDGGRIAISVENFTVRIYDARNGAPGGTLTGATGTLYGVDWSPDGATIVAVGGIPERRLLRWNANNGAFLDPFTIGDDYTFSVRFSPSGGQIATSGTGGILRVFDAASGSVLRSFANGGGTMWSSRWSADGRTLVTGNNDSRVRSFAFEQGGFDWTNSSSQAYVRGVACSPNGQWVASGDWDYSVRALTASTGVQERSMAFGPLNVNDLAVDESRNRLIVGSSFARLTVLDTRSNTLLQTADFFPIDLDLNAAADRLAIVDGGTPRVLYASSLDAIASFPSHQGGSFAAALSPNAQVLAVVGGRIDRRNEMEIPVDCTLKLYRIHDGALLANLAGHQQIPIQVAYSPDGAYAYTSGADGVRGWRLSDGTQTFFVPLRAFPLALSPNGGVLAAGDANARTITLIDAATGATLRTLSGHTAFIRRLRFFGNDVLLSSASGTRNEDLTLRAWRVSDGASLTIANRGTGTGVDEFVPGARRLYVSTEDNTVFATPNPVLYQRVNPANFEVTRGSLNGGVLGDLFDQDQRAVTIRQAFQLSPALPNAELTTTFQTGQPTFDSLRVTLVASATGVPAQLIRQQVDLFNFQDGEWEPIDERGATGADGVFSIVALGDAGRFVGAAGHVRARVNYRGTGPGPTWLVRVDQLVIDYVR